MTIRFILSGWLALLLAACGQPDDGPTGSETANPLLWEIAQADGIPGSGTKGWLMGTAHALPDGAAWRSETVDRVIGQADILAVEVDGLENGAEIAHAFAPLAFSPGQPPLPSRVASEQQGMLARLVSGSSYAMDDFTRIESWGAALILARSVETGADSANGVDRALIRDFAGRPIVELEGATRQFRIFDSLSERAQRAMLGTILKEAAQDDAERQRPIALFLAGDEAGIERLTHEGILADPEIRDALLVARNADWAQRIDTLLARDGRPLIAVGAAHLVGDDGLVALLEAEGYTLTRIR